MTTESDRTMLMLLCSAIREDARRIKEIIEQLEEITQEIAAEIEAMQAPVVIELTPDKRSELKAQRRTWWSKPL